MTESAILDVKNPGALDEPLVQDLLRRGLEGWFDLQKVMLLLRNAIGQTTFGFFVARGGDELVGFCILDTADWAFSIGAQILFFYCPHHQESLAGLADAIKKWCRARGIHKIGLVNRIAHVPDENYVERFEKFAPVKQIGGIFQYEV